MLKILNECVNRNKKRYDKLGEKAIKDIFKLVSAFDYGIKIDTNNKSPQEVVDEIITYLPK